MQETDSQGLSYPPPKSNLLLAEAEQGLFREDQGINYRHFSSSQFGEATMGI